MHMGEKGTQVRKKKKTESKEEKVWWIKREWVVKGENPQGRPRTLTGA
jgi:hypothetical protein